MQAWLRPRVAMTDCFVWHYCSKGRKVYAPHSPQVGIFNDCIYYATLPPLNGAPHRSDPLNEKACLLVASVTGLSINNRNEFSKVALSFFVGISLDLQQTAHIVYRLLAATHIVPSHTAQCQCSVVDQQSTDFLIAGWALGFVEPRRRRLVFGSYLGPIFESTGPTRRPTASERKFVDVDRSGGHWSVQWVYGEFVQGLSCQQDCAKLVSTLHSSIHTYLPLVVGWVECCFVPIRESRVESWQLKVFETVFNWHGVASVYR